MDVRKLEAFCQVYELQSFSKAGEVMFLSQPTISSHVANLEAELGVKLFDRLGRKVLPTQAGDVLYRSAVAVFENLKEARASIEMLRDKVVGDVAVGCSTIPSFYIVPRILSDFFKRYPQVTFTVHTGDSFEVIRRVACGDWPVGIVGELPTEEGVTSKLIFEDDTVVVAAKHAEWLPKDDGAISMETLARLPWVMRGKGSATRHSLEMQLGSLGLTLNDLTVRCWVDGTNEALAHTLRGSGVSVTSRLASSRFIESGALVRLNVPALEGKRHFYLIYNEGRHMLPALRAFIEHTSKGLQFGEGYSVE
ncbi:selenium metabolism-associated LysR family transcriptional regulator [Pseudodesulfovibrio sp.]|uniref:selenium metabolism-associated LysR family transcriptional regulator n=1 Tax=unclassified Pseudodesulfovibrio TaxID=2661612 RepID=UPI003B00FB89